MTVFHRGAWLHRFALLVSLSTFLLIIAGGLVTSTGSGLAVPDWPLSFGQVFPRMEGGVLFEHGHRMVASTVGLLTIALAFFASRAEHRGWVRRLAYTMVAVVVLQGLLGGLTVLMRLPDAVSIAHAGLAEVFFALTVVMASVTSPVFLDRPETQAGGGLSPVAPFAALTAAAIYLQILIGAVVRHIGAGLAIPGFPLSNGRLIPEFSNYLVGWQFAHRAFALVVAALIIACVVRVRRMHGDDPWLARPAIVLAALVIWQIFLGGLTIWTFRAVTPTTAHVASGALVWATAVLLAVRLRRASQMRAAVEPLAGAGVAR